MNGLTSTVHSDECSSHSLIPTVETPVNVSRNQIILKIGNETSYQLKTPFEGYHRHIFTERAYSEGNIIGIFKRYLNTKLVNGLSAPEHIMELIQGLYPIHFASHRIRYTQAYVEDNMK